jgi:ubiquinone/menaquinone biosynthesis C-methylase UbiE
MTRQDKELERGRYDQRARAELARQGAPVPPVPGSQMMPAYLRSPYLAYEAHIARLLRPSHRVLELGAGAGMHTLALLQSGARVLASDISAQSLTLLRTRFAQFGSQLETQVADMEQTPFADASFDAVATAGSLSYGAPDLVDAEIRRLLVPGGILLCVDSLNHNPVYRLNRWLHHLRGERSASTLRRMPDLARIGSLRDGFETVNLDFFGSISYAMPVIARFSGENTARTLSDRFDRAIGARRSAFKFVLVAQGYHPATRRT